MMIRYSSHAVPLNVYPYQNLPSFEGLSSVIVLDTTSVSFASFIVMDGVSHVAVRSILIILLSD